MSGRRGYSRADVQTHGDGFGRAWSPAVNVKVHLWGDAFPDAVLVDVADVLGHDPAAFLAWWRAKAEERTGEGWNDGTALGELIDGREGYGWSNLAAETAFGDAESNARDLFGSGVKVWQEGRSGGWLVVGGLPDLDTWDAVMLGRWRRFETWVRAAVADFPRAVAWLIAANVYEAELEEAEAECGRLAELDRQVTAWATLCGAA